MATMAIGNQVIGYGKMDDSSYTHLASTRSAPFSPLVHSPALFPCFCTVYEILSD